MIRAVTRGLLPILAAGHLVLALAAWLRASDFGDRRPDTVSVALALALTVVAFAVATAAFLVAGRETEARVVVLAVAALLLLPQALLQRRFDESRYCYEDGYASGLLASGDGAWRMSLKICEPYRPHRYARLELIRVADGRGWTLPLTLRRSPRDALTRRVRWAALRPIGDRTYWLELSTAVSRDGPQFFVLRTDSDPPRIDELTRGMTRKDGRATWDCSSFEQGADDVPARWADRVCESNDLIPPEAACLMQRLAAPCRPELLRAALCRPADAGGAPVDACLERLGDGALGPAAGDARLLASLERDAPAQLFARLAASDTADRLPAGECAAARHAARRLYAAQRVGWSSRARQALVDLLRERERTDSSGCPAGAPEIDDELDRDAAELAWRIAEIDRRWGFLDRSCQRTTEALGRHLSGSAESLSPASAGWRAEAERWLEVCGERGLDATRSGP